MVVPGSKLRMAAFSAPSLSCLGRCKDKRSILSAAASSFLSSGEGVTGSLMLGLCSQRLSVSEGWIFFWQECERVVVWAEVK